MFGLTCADWLFAIGSFLAGALCSSILRRVLSDDDEDTYAVGFRFIDSKTTEDED